MDIKNLTPSQMMDLAEDSNTTSDILEILSKHKDMFIRIAVAKNPNTSSDTLLSLGVEYKDYGWVSGWALENPNMKESDREYIYLNNPYFVSQNPNTPPETLTILTRYNDIEILCNVAENPNTPPETLTLLAKNEYWCVRYSVARNPNTPQYVKDYLIARNFMRNYD